MAGEIRGSNGAFNEDHHSDSIGLLKFEDVAEGTKIDIPIYPGAEIRIGRDSSKCSFVIENDFVSKEHFRIYSIIYEKVGNGDCPPPLIYCEDSESTNGTYVNNMCIGIICTERLGHLLVDSDMIEIRPNWRFQFRQPYLQTIRRKKTQLKDLNHIKNRYTVSDRVLGKGHYGAVYLAKEVASHKQVACKIVDIGVGEQRFYRSSKVACKPRQDQVKKNVDGRKQVMREIEILSKLSHPHIINIKKAFCSNCFIYIFTDIAPGGDLFSYIESQGDTLTDWNSRVIIRQVLLAVMFIHSKGIAHRDIKPENVLIMQTDFGGRVVLTDFGFAKCVNEKTGRLLSKLGSEGFIAPEVENVDIAKGGYTLAADLWSLGVLTAVMLTGSRVIPRGELSQLSQIQIAERFIGLDSHTRYRWQDLSLRALEFLRRLLIVNPLQRMTAVQALDHAWLKKPSSEADLIEQRYQKVIQFWRKRNDKDKIIEDISSKTTAHHKEKLRRLATKRARKLPDSTSSPYFGLDRHILSPRRPSDRRELLRKLKESRSPFLETESPRKLAGVVNSVSYPVNSPHKISHVAGNDMFGAGSSREPVASANSDPESNFLAPITLPAHIPQKQSGSHLAGDSHPTCMNQMMPRIYGEQDVEGSTDNPGRTDAENSEDRRIRDGVAMELPRYGTAKALKNAVSRRKEELGAYDHL